MMKIMFIFITTIINFNSFSSSSLLKSSVFHRMNKIIFLSLSRNQGFKLLFFSKKKKFAFQQIINSKKTLNIHQVQLYDIFNMVIIHNVAFDYYWCFVDVFFFFTILFIHYINVYNQFLIKNYYPIFFYIWNIYKDFIFF